ncbi:MAG TPA: GNAT family N-acetyltransferase [Feifaniaceae bacterium]|nr:GNAT family N-acetyltransferase [Feifaniaceae bacterium]
MQIREAAQEDLIGLLELYTHLHGNPMPEPDEKLRQVWDGILNDPNHHILLGELEGKPVCSCVTVVIPNLTRGQRPYALLENVVTHPAHRKKGYASETLAAAAALAQKAGCYKIMLLTGAKDGSTLRFYERAGFNAKDKTAFVRWL